MKIRKSQSIAGCLAALAMFASVCAHADLITNGGFETGDFTGWTQFGTGTFAGGVDTFAPQSGIYAAFFGNPVRTPSGIFQTLATTAGSLYKITFWLMNEVDANGTGIPNSFSFDWGGANELTLTNVAGPTPYTQYSFTLLATSSSTDLRFTFASDPAFWDFDSVAVGLPEPGSLALVALGGAMIAAFKRRRRHA